MQEGSREREMKDSKEEEIRERRYLPGGRYLHESE